MKSKSVLLLTIAAIVIFGACNAPINEQPGTSLKPFTETPVSIYWNGDSNDGIQSFQANVKAYRMNNRKDTAAGLSQTYRMAIRSTDEKVVSRVDYNFDKAVPFRSVITDGEEAIVFNPDTEEIGYRIPMEDSDSPLQRIFASQSGMSRINLSLIREEATRLSLDIEELSEGQSKKLILEFPPEMIPQNGVDRITRSRAVFDITEEVLLETEVQLTREDGTFVNTTVMPVYEDKDGTPVKVGMVTVMDSKAPGLIDGINSDMPVYESPDDVPTLSESELAEMKANGGIYEIPDIEFGNPADLSFTETVYEVYSDIEINTAPESLFRLIQK